MRDNNDSSLESNDEEKEDKTINMIKEYTNICRKKVLSSLVIEIIKKKIQINLI